MEVLLWLENTPLAHWVLASSWANPVLLCMHAIGMSLVVGCGLMTSLRILGFARFMPLTFFRELFAFAWTGVCLNVSSGALLFIADAHKYMGNWTFQLKIALILAGSIATWVMWRILAAEQPYVAEQQLSTRARVAAIVTAVFWIGAIIAGRMIAYTLTPGLE
ncbi:MAG: hypothetical protein JWP92_2118 [Caulobacter sp.]|nr:hypothetical protein [Caulobacter sp.]